MRRERESSAVIAVEEELVLLRRFIESFLGGGQWPVERIKDVCLGVTEVVANCLVHNDGGDRIHPITVDLRLRRKSLIVVIMTEGYASAGSEESVLAAYQATDGSNYADAAVASMAAMSGRGVYLAKMTLAWSAWWFDGRRLFFFIPLDPPRATEEGATGDVLPPRRLAGAVA